MTSVNDLPAKWRSEINGCAIDNCAHCLSLAVALNELEAALAQQTGVVNISERCDNCGEVMHLSIASSAPGGGGEVKR